MPVLLVPVPLYSESVSLPLPPTILPVFDPANKFTVSGPLPKATTPPCEPVDEPKLLNVTALLDAAWKPYPNVASLPPVSAPPLVKLLVPTTAMPEFTCDEIVAPWALTALNTPRAVMPSLAAPLIVPARLMTVSAPVAPGACEIPASPPEIMPLLLIVVAPEVERRTASVIPPAT